jgi:membrane protein
MSAAQDDLRFLWMTAWEKLVNESMSVNVRPIVELVKETLVQWNEHKAPRLAAALAYYTVFSLAPLLIVVIAIAGFVFGQQAVRSEIVTQFQNLVGDLGAQAVQAIIEGARTPGSSVLATVIGSGTLLLGAGGLFGQLQDALNTIWEVTPKPGRGIMNMVRARFLSFALVLGTGFLLLASLIVSAALQAFGGYLSSLAPNLGLILELLNTTISMAVITVLFALIFRVLPDVNIAWGDVWIGAGATAILFTIGKFAIGFYLGRSSTASTYGAAGSLVVLLIWVYYAAQILLLGAEFTHVYANEYGSHPFRSEGARQLTEHALAKQGISHSRQLMKSHDHQG